MVTIVILIILATVSINVVMGEDGLIKQAEKGAQYQSNAEAEDNSKIDELDRHIANAIAENVGTQTPEEPENPSDPDTPTDTEGMDAVDILANPSETDREVIEFNIKSMQ